MPEPSMGQPFIGYPGIRVSVGDLIAPYGTNAFRGVVILEGGNPSPYIISPITQFQVQAQVRTVLGAADYFLPPTLVTRFFIVNLITGAIVPGSPFIGLAPVNLVTPAGDHGVDGPLDANHITWYAINSPVIPALPQGVYRITVVGHDGDILFVHEDTVILVR